MRRLPSLKRREVTILDEALATAQELGMKKVIDHCLALQQRAQGAEPTSP